MDKKILITETELKSLIKEEVEKLLQEYAVKASEYYQRLDEILIPIMNNLLCIAIFHDVNSDILNHWCNRAKQLPARLFDIKVKSSVVKSINQAFIDNFGEKWEDIDEDSYQQNIKYYSNKPPHERMIPKRTMDEIYKASIGFVSEALISLKEALLNRDRASWENAVDDFYRKVTN